MTSDVRNIFIFSDRKKKKTKKNLGRALCGNRSVWRGRRDLQPKK